MVTRIRSNFCQYSWVRCGTIFLSVYDALGKTGIEGSRKERHCLERLRKDVAEIVFVDLYLLGSDVGPLWSQRSGGTSVSIGCFWERLKGVRGKGIA